MRKIFAAAAIATILSACGNGNSTDQIDEQAEVAEALMDQQAQVAQSMQDRWKNRTGLEAPAEDDQEEETTRRE